MGMEAAIAYLVPLLFSFRNNHRNLDTSNKMDLNHWDCLGRVKHVL